MVFKNFRTNIIIRVLILAGSIFLFFYSFQTNYFITPIIIAIVIFFEISALIRYLDKTNRELTSFLESIRFAEFSRSFQIQGMGSSFDELNRAFNDVIRDFQKVRSEKEEHFHYLQTIVQNIDVSLIAYKKDGNIELINKAAKKLFQFSGLKNIKMLDAISQELVDTLFEIKPGENKLVKIRFDDDILQLALYATTIKIKDNIITLATIKDIQNVLEEQETEAWQKLIRVLTHEIMNSITPIASLSSTLDLMLKSLTDNKDKDENISIEAVNLEEIQQALQTINRRSTGLLHFVNTYRNLTRIPKPNFRVCQMKELLTNIQRLMEKEITEKNISLTTTVEPEDITFTADEQLIEQVLINLVRNSVYAINRRRKGKIILKGFRNKRGQVTIQVVDNGHGILKDVIDKIFIPFFTTKSSGSGIGLSLSRQILRLHNGTISAQSVPDEETIFTLTFS